MLPFFTLKINEETDFVEIHSVDLDLENVTFKSGTSEEDKMDFDRIKSFTKSEMVRIYFKKKLVKGPGKLEIDFKGTYPEDEGLYRNECFGRNGKTKYGVCTQFEVFY